MRHEHEWVGYVGFAADVERDSDEASPRRHRFANEPCGILAALPREDEIVGAAIPHVGRAFLVLVLVPVSDAHGDGLALVAWEGEGHHGLLGHVERGWLAARGTPA